ncbi:MAG: polyprenyl diphosphate synthase [Polyangiaceae bacterium]|nr:polyprenyl diphosphate synthase [Polyangiaceae bacterium]
MRTGSGDSLVNASKAELPRHIAIIMDGNGRWAKARGLERVEGHAEGARAVRETVESCAKLGVQFLTLYAFSVANWARPPREVQALMKLLVYFANREKEDLRNNGVRVRVVGNLDDLPLLTRHSVEELMAYTADCQGMTLSLALSYGGRKDIVDAARALAAKARAGLLLPEDIDEASFQREMSTEALPNVDLLIRTGGETRVSDFLLFESAYAEFVFLPIMWPEFDAKALGLALDIYAGKERRFGLTSEQVQRSVHSFDPPDLLAAQ